MRLVFILGMLMFAFTAQAQVLNLGAVGSDQLGLGVRGGSLNVYLPRSDSSFSFAINGNQTLIGATEQTTIDGVYATVGDSMLSVPFQSDFSSLGYGLQVRGITLTRQPQPTDDSKLSVFIGQTAAGYGFPMVQAAKSDGPAVGVVSYERRFGSFTVQSLDIASSKQTAIQSLSWRAHHWLTVAGSIGIEGNRPAGSLLADIKTRRASLRAGYGFGSDSELLHTLNTLLISNVGLNASGSYAPLNWLTVSGSRANYASFSTTESEAKSTVNSVGFDERYRTLDISEAGFRGSGPAGISSGIQTGARLEIGRFNLSSNWYQSATETTSYAILLNSVSIRVAPRLQGTAYVTTSEGKTSVNVGGSYGGNHVALNVGYAEEFFPISAGNRNPFAKVLSVSVSVHIHDANITAATVETPGQSMKVTVYGGSYVYGPYKADAAHSGANVGRYVVQGVVLDADDEPIQGAAVSVGSTVVWTDTHGMFHARFRKQQDYAVSFSAGDSLMAAAYVATACPATAHAELDGKSSPVTIRLERAQ